MKTLILIFLMTYFSITAQAAEQRYAIIDDATGQCVNSVIWDGDKTKWSPPKGTTAVIDDTKQMTQEPQPIIAAPKTPSEIDKVKQDIADIKAALNIV